MAKAKKSFVDSVTTLLRDQFEAHQLDRIDEDDSAGTGKSSKINTQTTSAAMVAALSRATRIQKELHILQLNQDLAGLSVEGSNQGSGDDAGLESIVSQILVDYLTACMADTVNEPNPSPSTEMDSEEKACVSNGVCASVVDLTVALAILTGETPLLALVSCLVEASTVLSDKLRGMACEAMGTLAATLAEWNKRNRKDRSVATLDTQQLVLVELTEAIQPRLTDKSTSVRGNSTVAAASVLRLTGSQNVSTSTAQEDDDNQESDDNELLEAWLWNLWHDPSVSNRVLAIGAIPISSESSDSRRAVLVDHLISRLRDVKEKVRVAAVQALHTKVASLADFSSIQMAEIVKSGLSARCHATKEATSKLICSKWMKLAKFNALNLLESIDVQSNEDEAEQMVRIILEAITNVSVTTNSKSCASWLDDLSAPEIRAFQNSITNHLVGLDTLAVTISAEQVFLARVACTGGDIDNRHGDVTMLQKVVPDISVLCSMFQDHSYKMIEAMEQKGNANDSASSIDGERVVEYHCFLCLQLLPLATAAGLAEEGSRRRLTSMLQAILSSPATPDDLVEGAVQALHTACHFDTSGQEIVQSIESVLNELQKQQQAALSEECVAEDSGIAGLCILRILSILSIFLELVSPSRPVRDLLEKMSDSVINAIKNDSNILHEGLIREAGVCCLGKMGLYSDESLVLRVYKPLLLRIAAGIDRDNERLEIRSQALMALSDWAMVFSEILQPTPTDSTEAAVVFMDILVQDFLQSENPSTACIAAEIAVKLLFASRICESGIIARLLVLFFDPRHQVAAQSSRNENDQGSSTEIGSYVRVQQLLSLFFPAFCWQSKHARDAVLGSIESALQEAISQKTFASRGKGTKARKAAFPLVKLVEYVCSIVTISDEPEEGQTENGGIAPQKTDSGEEDYKIALTIAVQVGQFVLSALLRDDEVGTKSINLTQCRGLCKLLGSLEVSSEEGTVSTDYSTHVGKLKDNMEELGMVLTDGTALRSLSPLTQELSEVEIVHDEEIFPNNASPIADRKSLATQGRQSNASTLTEAISTGSGETTLDDSLMMAGKENYTGKSHRSSRNSKGIDYLDSGSVLRSSNRLSSISNF